MICRKCGQPAQTNFKSCRACRLKGAKAQRAYLAKVKGGQGRSLALLETRFWNRVVKSNGCWLWAGAVGPTGYGFVEGWPFSRKAHRVSWFIATGQVPVGLCVCHKCDVPSCVRPEHLFVGTQKDNAMDMGRKGRARPKRGEESCFAKLTTDQVIAILRHSGKRREIAAEFGVSVDAIRDIQIRRNWKHVSTGGLK